MPPPICFQTIHRASLPLAAERPERECHPESPQQNLESGPAARAVVDAASCEIEQRFLIHLSDAGAVSAPDIVGTDFELRLRVDLRMFGEQKVSVVLHRIRFLRVFANDDRAVENALPVSAQNAFV